ncbi:MAG: hypothetical protein Ct9H300mP28_27310 [Pseudomonadota bacterium]|nr:MAG: hypothetical protein Ct9H300mP28_27310 [Pseudomonadota bacterium]
MQLLFGNNPEIASKLFGRKIGRILPGYQADLAIYDYSPRTPITESTVFGHVFFGLSELPSDVITRGDFRIKDRQLLMHSEKEKKANASLRQKNFGVISNNQIPSLKKMAELIPHPFGSLVKRMFHELETADSIFDYPSKKIFIGTTDKNYSVKFHGKKSSSPLGPASGPQTQMAQNILLSWLGAQESWNLKLYRFWMNCRFLGLALTCRPSATMWNGRRN